MANASALPAVLPPTDSGNDNATQHTRRLAYFVDADCRWLAMVVVDERGVRMRSEHLPGEDKNEWVLVSADTEIDVREAVVNEFWRIWDAYDAGEIERQREAREGAAFDAYEPGETRGEHR